MFCTECGAQINYGGKFCGKCGTSLSDIEEQNLSEEDLEEQIIESWERDSNKRGHDAGLNRSRKQATYRSSHQASHENNNLDSSLIKAFKRRQKDSWGKALLHWIPLFGILYAIYYIFSRRTITPSTYSFIWIFLIFLSKNVVSFMPYLLFLIYPFVVKKGISQAREYGKLRLKKMI